MSIETLKTRLTYAGGAKQQERMNKDKLRGLKKALIYSYQAATAILSDGREFRCLINPNKLSLDLDNKILSIPFEDVCLNSDKVGITTEGIVATDIKEGDVIEWKENGSHWLVFLQRLEETAYFRADLRRCRYEITLDNGNKYWIYVRGPVEQSILWAQGGGNYYNKPNYSLVLYVTQNEETLEYFHRFSKININGQPWEIQAIDSISTPGIIEVALKETYKNTPQDDIDAAVAASIDVQKIDEKEETYIYGLSKVFPYDVVSYEIKNYNGKQGIWKITNESRKNLTKIKEIKENGVTIHIITGKSGSFTLVYEDEAGAAIAALDIKISSL